MDILYSFMDILNYSRISINELWISKNVYRITIIRFKDILNSYYEYFYKSAYLRISLNVFIDIKNSLELRIFIIRI